MLSKSKDTTKKQLYDRALSFFLKGKLQNAQNCCNKAILENPNHCEAYNMLGVIADKQGKQGEAFTLFKKALSINPQYAAGYSNLGGCFLQSKIHDQAIKCFKKVISLEPQNASAYYNIGCSFDEQGDHNNAIAFFRKTLEIDSNHVKAYNNIGNILLAHGQIPEAIKSFEASITNKENKASGVAYINLTSAILYQEGCLAWKNILEKFSNEVDFEQADKGNLLNYLAIANWVAGDQNECLELLDRSKELFFPHTNYHDYTVITAFNRLLRGIILSYRRLPEIDKATSGTIHFIGDSHSLTCSNKKIDIAGNIFECKTHFVLGCKIWHLINDVPNKHKVSFQREVQSLKAGDRVVLSLGEIDSRYDEGLFLRYRKYGTDFKSEAEKLLNNYFAKIVLPLKSQGIVPIVWNIPAPHEGLIDEKVYGRRHKKEFVDFIACFNTCLDKLAKEHSVELVDNYKLTSQDNSCSSFDTHLDWYHLRPASYIKALQGLRV